MAGVWMTACSAGSARTSGSRARPASDRGSSRAGGARGRASNRRRCCCTGAVVAPRRGQLGRCPGREALDLEAVDVDGDDASRLLHCRGDLAEMQRPGQRLDIEIHEGEERRQHRVGHGVDLELRVGDDPGRHDDGHAPEVAKDQGMVRIAGHCPGRRRASPWRRRRRAPSSPATVSWIARSRPLHAQVARAPGDKAGLAGHVLEIEQGDGAAERTDCAGRRAACVVEGLGIGTTIGGQGVGRAAEADRAREEGWSAVQPSPARRAPGPCGSGSPRCRPRWEALAPVLPSPKVTTLDPSSLSRTV